MNRITLLDLPVDKLDFKESIQKCDQLIQSPYFQWGVTLNPEIAMFAQKDQRLKEAIQKAALVTPDGIGISWAMERCQMSEVRSQKLFVKWVGTVISGLKIMFSPYYKKEVLPERVTGVDLVRVLFSLATKKQYRIFLLGGQSGVARGLKKKLINKYPNIQIVGATAGFNLGIKNNVATVTESDQKKEREVINQIQKTKPHLLLVAFGPPKQEHWILNHQKELKNVGLAMGIGGTFDFLLGKAKRSPWFFQKIGLEWVWRLIVQPKRFFRMIKTIPTFVWKITNQKLE